MRHTRSHTNNRRAHHALAGISVVVDKESGALRRAHRLDETTGSYRGRVIATPKKKKERTKAEKHDHPAHTHVEPVADKDSSQKPKVLGTHEHGDSLPTSRRGA
ncbi:MAG: 50S ribosomal protein L32 [Parcubacteria group bacterium 21-54-25]|nr:MAG: 50S ribosomal protein L32 [Parcubacteria group bacterium 21-54-25]